MTDINSALNNKALNMAMDSGSNYNFYRGTEVANIPRSNGNLSYTNTFSANEGQLIPCWTQHTLLCSDYKCRVSSVVRVVNPPVVPLMSRQRIYFNSFWASYSQLWKDAQIFFTKSKTSTTSPRKLIPYITLSSWKRGDLADYLGLTFDSQKDTPVHVPALKFMLYLRIYRDYFSNQRFWSSELDRLIADGDTDAKLIKNFVFPDDDSEFRIGTASWNALTQSCIDKLFTSVYYRNWTDDYFTKAQLTPLYTDTIPEIPLSMSVPVAHAIPTGNHGSISGSAKNVSSFVDSQGKRVVGLGNPTSGDFSMTDFIDAFNNTATVKLDESSISGLTLDAIRKCACDTSILEKMAKINGSYKEFARIIFGETPRSSMDYTPLYIGGTYQNIEYSTVVNSSGYGVQGQLSGLGMSSGNSDIGTFHSDDFGLGMTICCIMPDTYYCQGWNKTDLYMTSDDFFYPERAGLGMQAITLSEIYKTGTEADNKVFGYQNRFDELRYRQNEVHGKVADKNSQSFFPYIQTRYFESAPTLSPSFVSTKGTIPKDWLSVTEEIPYLVQVSNICEPTHPVPYRAKENNFGF